MILLTHSFFQLGYSPLLEACSKANVQIVLALLEAKADVNQRDKVGEFLKIEKTIGDWSFHVVLFL